MFIKIVGPPLRQFYPKNLLNLGCFFDIIQQQTQKAIGEIEILSLLKA
jgi:hypothetical protein